MGGDEIPIDSREVDRFAHKTTALLSPDLGTVSISLGCDLSVLNAATGQSLNFTEIWGISKDDANCYQIGPDGQLLAEWTDVDSLQSTLRIWDARTGSMQHELTFPRGEWDLVPARTVFSPDSRLLAIEHFEGVLVWDLNVGRLQFALDSGISQIAFSDDGRHFVTVSYGGSVQIWDSNTGNLIRELSGPDGSDQDLAVSVSPDGQKVVIGSEHGSVRLWDLETGSQLHEHQRNSTWVTLASISPDGNLFAIGMPHAGHRDEPVYDKFGILLWDAKVGRPIQDSGGQTRIFDSLDDTEFTQDGFLAVEGRRVGSVHSGLGRLQDKFGELSRTLTKIWNPYTQEYEEVGPEVLSPNGRIFAVTQSDGSIAVGNTETGELTAEMHELSESGCWRIRMGVDFSNDGSPSCGVGQRWCVHCTVQMGHFGVDLEFGNR